MTLAALKPGIRQRIYMGSWSFDNAPSVYETDREAAETIQRLADSSLYWSLASLWTGCPDRIYKRTWQVAFEAPSADDLLHLRMLASDADTFNFCPWLAESESYTTPLGMLSSPSKSGRRNAVDVISSGLVPAGDWTAGFLDTSGTEHHVAWGTADTVSPWGQEWVPEAMATDVPGRLIFYPVYRVMLAKSSEKFTLAHREMHTLALREV